MSSRLLRSGLLGLMTAGIAATEAHAAPAKRAKPASLPAKQVVTTFAVAKNADPRLVEALRNHLPEAPKALPQVRLLSGKGLRKALGANVEGALANCGAKLDCLIKVSRKAQADKILVVQVAPTHSAVHVEWQVVDVHTGRTESQTAFDLAAVGAAERIIGPQLVAAFSSGRISPAEANEPALMAAVPDIPLEDLPAAPATDIPLAMIDEPKRPNAPDASTGPLALAPAPALVAYPQTRWWRRAGAGLAAIGAAGVGIGAVFGMQSTSTRNGVKLGPDGTTQLAAWQKMNDANRAARRANLLMTMGAAAAVAGGVFFAMDWSF